MRSLGKGVVWDLGVMEGSSRGRGDGGKDTEGGREDKCDGKVWDD